MTVMFICSYVQRGCMDELNDTWQVFGLGDHFALHIFSDPPEKHPKFDSHWRLCMPVHWGLNRARNVQSER